MHERRPGERPGLFGPRFKVGLETPLQGRFVGESRLVFAPPRWYDLLVWACLVCGPVTALPFAPVPLDPDTRRWVGAAVFLAGVWALLSNERMSVDLRSRSYVRLEGQGLFKRLTRGRLDEIDAVVVVTEAPARAMGAALVHRTVLYWKGGRLPPLVAEQLVVPGAPVGALNAQAGPIVGRAARYAHALGLPFFDNSHFLSPEPLRPL